MEATSVDAQDFNPRLIIPKASNLLKEMFPLYSREGFYKEPMATGLVCVPCMWSSMVWSECGDHIFLFHSWLFPYLIKELAGLGYDLPDSYGIAQETLLIRAWIIERIKMAEEPVYGDQIHYDQKS